MPRGRATIRLKLGHHYRTDNGRLIYVLKHFPELPKPFFVKDDVGEYHHYTEKGRYTTKFGNHPMHINHEVIIRNGIERKRDPRRRGRLD
jgi:hypothetical protein